MGRWRPPARAAAPYITAAGYRALEVELRALWTRRRDVVRHLAAAAAEGDRSENAEYQYRKKELRGIDRRIGYLQRRMPKLTVVATAPEDTSKVFFGARVELEDAGGQAFTYRIVGSDEAEPAAGDISVDSPVARRLLGRALDDEVSFELAGMPASATIVAIDYPDPAA
ncbi:MAG: GreA/GreB family elongation factor [Gammaproteobacteria bacterium]